MRIRLLDSETNWAQCHLSNVVLHCMYSLDCSKCVNQGMLIYCNSHLSVCINIVLIVDLITKCLQFSDWLIGTASVTLC